MFHVHDQAAKIGLHLGILDACLPEQVSQIVCQALLTRIAPRMATTCDLLNCCDCSLLLVLFIRAMHRLDCEALFLVSHSSWEQP